MVFSDIKEAWDFLVSYPHRKYTVGNITYFEWDFYDKNENMYKLEHEVCIVKRYAINNWFLFKNCKETCMIEKIENIVSLINDHKKNIKKSYEYVNKNQLLMDSLIDKLGKCTSYIDNKVTWNLGFEKIKMKIVFLMYMDNENVKNISLDILENKKQWKKTKVDKTQLLNFLEKNKRKIVITSKICYKYLVTKIAKLSLKRNMEDDDEENELVNKFSKVKLYHDKNISNTYSKLFIQIDREKRYEIQACKKFK